MTFFLGIKYSVFVRNKKNTWEGLLYLSIVAKRFPRFVLFGVYGFYTGLLEEFRL